MKTGVPKIMTMRMNQTSRKRKAETMSIKRRKRTQRMLPTWRQTMTMIFRKASAMKKMISMSRTSLI